MRLGVRGKLFATSFLVIVAAVAASFWYLKDDVPDGVLLAGGLIALGIALAMSWLASYLITAELRQLVARARTMVPMADDDPPRDEIRTIAGSLEVLSEELDRALTKLAAKRTRFSAVLDGMSEAVVALDHRSRIDFVNTRALELLNLDAPPIGDTMFETLRVAELQEATAAAHGGDIATVEFDMPASPLRVLVTATPQRGSKGCVLVFRDVTEIRRLERVRRDFVSNVSHELRTPVSVVRANAETLVDAHGEDPARTQPLVDAIARHADRLSRIIDDLLDLSRLEAGKRTMKLAPTTIREVALHAAELVASDRVAVDVDAELEALADREALQQVLVNLIDNAVKYSPADTEVTVTARADGDRVRITVADRGPGIAREHRGRVFERFYRVDAGRSREVGGTGLGLSIVKHLAEAMDGTAGLDETESGSAFWIALGRPTS